MYQGNNKIAIQSQRMISEALLELMQEKDFSKINIKELCTKALVSRQTFYSLFNSKEEVISMYLDMLFDDYISRFDNHKKLYTLKDLCDETIHYLIQHRELLELLVKNHLDYVVKERVEDYLMDLDQIFHVAKGEKGAYAIAFFSGALLAVISQAIKNNDFYDGEKISGIIEEILTGDYLAYSFKKDEHIAKADV